MVPRTKKGGDDWHVERFRYLERLVQEYRSTSSKGAKRQVIANLANFAYDPVNYGHLRALNVIEIFIDIASNTDDEMVEYAMGGLANLATCEVSREYILGHGLPNIIACLGRKSVETVISVLTTLILVADSTSRDALCAPDLLSAVEALRESENARIRNLVTILVNDYLDSKQSATCTNDQ